MSKVSPRHIVAGLLLLGAVVWIQLPEIRGSKDKAPLIAAIRFAQVKEKAIVHAPAGAVFADYGRRGTGYLEHSTNRFEVFGLFTVADQQPQRWSAHVLRDRKSWIITRLTVAERTIRPEDLGERIIE